MLILTVVDWLGLGGHVGVDAGVGDPGLAPVAVLFVRDVGAPAVNQPQLVVHLENALLKTKFHN